MQTSELLIIIGWAVAWGAVIGAASLLILKSLRRASFAVQICVVVLAAVAVLTAGMVSAFNAMFISARDLEVMWYVLAVASAVAVSIALVLGSRVSRNAKALADAARSIGRGESPGIQSPVMSHELAALAAELESSSRMLEASRQREAAVENARRELVSWISHDLRTPLASMRAMTEALEDGMAADVPAYYRKIIAQTDVMAGMVNDLLELSKIHAGTMRLKAEPLDLYDLASDAIADLAALAQQHGITLDGGGRRESLALADGPSMGRAIRNVVLNAIVHSAPGSRVTVEVGRQGDRAVVAVTDGCGGIPEEDLPHVFETGWQKDPARKRPGRWAAGDDGAVGDGAVVDGVVVDGAVGDGAAIGGDLVPGPAEPAGAMRYSGAGLGLSIVAGIVSAHQGTVTVENVDGGCRFSLLLPGQGSAGQESAAAAPAAGVAPAPRAATEGAKDGSPRDAADEQLRAGRAQ
ncbi:MULTISPECIES: sensor histidine kinase [unclassified Arthrobacter]|uniref:sensor histidine kinase n=1 Tax=unclassified Arthrobacter TaxID=235627 RepID=UPI001DA1A16B|nr:HAMP domain-containing sensor histidine kinase [Arthrobacter sp. Bi26]CAH0172116.1 Sensor histidine kinase ResE [Arthrobacter sp. Bi26]